ncbi:MAG TPA: MgtC/SapB family protein [Kofleriaceae bacterium]|nr:MgtC/SapB family protein [Kofleriaceae bacterium]
MRLEPYEPHLALLTALAVGILIGLEREQAQSKDKEKTAGGTFAGIRTYPIFALTGALAMILEAASIWLPLIALAGVITLVAIHYAHDVKSDRQHGVTTEASVIATYLLGALAASRGVVEPMATRLLLVGALGVVLTFLLSSKDWLHGIAGRVSRDDFYSTVKFLIAAVIILPLLPNEELGPMKAINPFTVGLMVVMISGLSFIGYVAMRLLGKGRGVLVSAGVGGLVSSTAVTISFAGRTKEDPSMAPAAAGAIAIASTIMLVRVGVLVALINPSLLSKLLIPLGAAAVGAILGGVLMYRRSEETKVQEVGVKNPFELGTAIRFGIVFAIILFAIKAAKDYFGDAGLYLAAALGGTTDVDAVTLSTAKHATAGEIASVVAIMIATVSNTIVKSSLALGIGGARLGKRAFVIGGLIVAGAVAGSLSLFAF